MNDDQQKREELLLTLYEMSGGNPIQGVLGEDLRERIGVDKEHFLRLALYLKTELLIKFQTFSSIAIDHWGIKEVERLMEESYSKKKRQVLEAIADMSRMSEFVLFPSLMERLKMSDRELSKLCNGLDEQGLIDFPGGDVIQMKDAGYEELEPKRTSLPVNFMHIEHNYGAAAQGSHFTQNVQVKNEFESSIEKLIRAVNESEELSVLQRVSLVNDIQLVQQLGQLEQTPEVIQAAQTRIDTMTSVISTTADIVSLGMVVVPIIRAFFGQ